MKSCISEGFIFVVLCASLASCSNLLKRPSDSTGPKNEKKPSSRANPQKSTSHHSNSLHPAIHSESLPYEDSEYLLSKSTFSDFSNANSISPAASSIELPFGTEPDVSHGPDKNSTPLYDDLSQSKTAKNCSSGAKSSAVLKQNQSSSSHRSVSLVKKQSSKSQSEKETIKDLPYPTVQENSVQDLSTSRDQQPNVPRPVLVGRFWTLKWSLGIMSFSQSVASPSKSLRKSFSYREKKKNFKMYFGSENFNNLLCFRYAVQVVRWFSDPESIFSENFKSKEIRKVFAVFSTFSSLPSHLLPFYYSFSFFYDTLFQAREFTRIPFYFLFTTISYLLKNEHDENAQYLKPLLKPAYQKILNGNKFKSAEWNFLKNSLSQYFDISDLNFEAKGRSDYIQLDISSVSLIYHEMRFGSNEKVKSFFSEVWEKSKQECSRKNDLQISKSPEIFIPSKDGISPNIFEREARKLYQIEFTNLLFKEWNQMEDLLEEFAQLKSYFATVIIDFRLRTFSANDFELLNRALEHIYSLFKRFSFNKKSLVHSFLVELEYFINFKCILFLFDLCNELKESDSVNHLYQETFETITTISELFEKIHSFSSNYFEFNPIDLDIIKSNSNIQSLDLTTLIEKCRQFVDFKDIRLFDEAQDEFDEFFVQLKNYDYFDKKFSIFLPNNLSRFKWAEFADELNEILDNKNEEEIAKIFFDEKYENVRKVWNSVTKLLEISSIQNKKQYLELLKTYLILYNQ